jgi:flagellar hook-associated protein 2
MKITGSYNNYLTMTSLLSPLGARGSGDLVMQVFSSAVGKLQNKINQQILSNESAAALKQLYHEVSDLASKASKLTGTDMDSVFNDRTATSSDTTVLKATAFDALSLDTGASEATYNIAVTKLAQAQENIGLALNNADPSVVDLGTNTFNLNTNGQDHQLSIDVTEGDTNEVVLQKMASAINDAGIGVSAEAIAGSVEGTQQFVVTADQTGMASSFSVSDISGNAVAATGMETVSTAAQDAEYKVDGTDYSSETNTIYLDGGMVTVNLQGTGESVLTVAPDQGEVKNAIAALVSEVNSLMSFLEGNSDYINDKVLSSVNSFITDHESELEGFGIVRGEDGTLEIDTDKLTLAVSDNLAGIKEAFGGFDGLGVQINNYASRVVTDSPLQYAEEAEGMHADFVDSFYNVSSGMLQQILQGSLLDTFV